MRELVARLTALRQAVNDMSDSVLDPVVLDDAPSEANGSGGSSGGPPVAIIAASVSAAAVIVLICVVCICRYRKKAALAFELEKQERVERTLNMLASRGHTVDVQSAFDASGRMRRSSVSTPTAAAAAAAFSRKSSIDPTHTTEPSNTNGTMAHTGPLPGVPDSPRSRKGSVCMPPGMAAYAGLGAVGEGGGGAHGNSSPRGHVRALSLNVAAPHSPTSTNRKGSVNSPAHRTSTTHSNHGSPTHNRSLSIEGAGSTRSPRHHSHHKHTPKRKSSIQVPGQVPSEGSSSEIMTPVMP